MFMFFFLMIVSFTYFLVHTEGETTCDCSKLGDLEVMMPSILYENRLILAKLKRLEERQSTASHSKIPSVSNEWSPWSEWGDCPVTCGAGLRERCRKCKLQFGCIGNSKDFSICNTDSCDSDRIEKLEHKVEDLEMKFTNTSTTAEEKQEGFGAIVMKTLMSEKKERVNMNKNIIEQKKSLETFKIAMNSSIDECFEHINAIKDGHSHDITETVSIALTNISTFQEDIKVEINRRLDGLEEVNKEAFETLKVIMNSTLDRHFENITPIQSEHSHDIKETFSMVLNNMSTFQENIVIDVNRRLDTIEQVNKNIQFITTGLNTVNKSLHDTRNMIEALDKLVEEDKEWSPWSNWGKCSKTCDAGLRERSRTCTSKFGCKGNSKDLSICNTDSCISDWSAWSEWGDCSKTCDAGLRERSRTCASQHGCMGNSKDFSICNIESCVSVRLVNGTTRYEGRLEVYYDGVWGTVCDDNFDENAASVVCKMLNLPSDSTSVHGSAHYGKGTLPILLDDVNCKGTEDSIFSCGHRPWGEDNCGHSEDVGISCTSVRLVNGRNPYEGRLEVFYDGGWGTVCDDEFDKNAARVVCKMLKLPSDVISVHGEAHFEQGSLPTMLDDVKCHGTETSIFSCGHKPWGESNCDNSEDVGVSCSPVRLVDGLHPYEGRLEVYHDGAWGTVCDDNFGENAARVVCKMLNIKGDVIRAHGSARFGHGSLPILLDDVNCKGSEASIFSCGHKPWGKNNCGHSEDVGVSCASRSSVLVKTLLDIIL